MDYLLLSEKFGNTCFKNRRHSFGFKISKISNIIFTKGVFKINATNFDIIL